MKNLKKETYIYSMTLTAVYSPSIYFEVSATNEKEAKRKARKQMKKYLNQPEEKLYKDLKEEIKEFEVDIAAKEHLMEKI